MCASGISYFISSSCFNKMKWLTSIPKSRDTIASKNEISSQNLTLEPNLYLFSLLKKSSFILGLWDTPSVRRVYPVL